jgi:hypothetical protein
MLTPKSSGIKEIFLKSVNERHLKTGKSLDSSILEEKFIMLPCEDCPLRPPQIDSSPPLMKKTITLVDD